MSGGCGTRAGYDRHRRAGQTACDPCRRAAARYEQERQLDLLRGRPRLVDATGTRRRIQALIALGYRHTILAVELGVSHDVIRKRSLAPKVNRDTAEAVAAMYERLSMTCPVGRTHHERVAISRARNLAARRGWAPPLAWDDIDTDPTPTGAGWTATRWGSELLAEWGYLRAAGESIEQAARQLGVTVDAIEKAGERAKRTAA